MTARSPVPPLPAWVRRPPRVRLPRARGENAAAAAATDTAQGTAAENTAPDTAPDKGAQDRRPVCVRLRVPATTANLGPGFDSFGLALGLYDEITLRLTDSGLAVEVSGPEPVAADETNLVVRSIRAAFDELGWKQPGLALRCVNRIPHGRGLGSSAAAIVAGIAAADALAGGVLGRDGLLRVATAIEGHPDNVAAAIYGGMTVAWYEGDVPRALRVEPVERLRPVLFIPANRQSTEQSRVALPSRVAHADAAANVGRAALLALALSADQRIGADLPGGRADGERADEAAGRQAAEAERSRLLMTATEDRLHQPFRFPAAPATAELVRRLRDAGIPAALSGSGPSVVAFALGGEQAAAAVGVPAPGFSVAPLAVDTAGVRIDSLE